MSHWNRKGRWALAVAVGVLSACRAGAQEVTHTPSATAPSPGVLMARQLAHFMRFSGSRADGPFTVNQWVSEHVIAMGVTPDLTAMVHVPLLYRDFNEPATSRGESTGIGDTTLMAKYRFYQDDRGAIATTRMSLLLGVEVPTYDEGFSSDSFDPLVGVAVTALEGRHGWGAYLQYKWNTGDRDDPIDFGDQAADAVRLDGSYLYRLAPDAYTATTQASSYLMLEVNGRYETNGDWEVLFSPGVLYEAKRWAVEVSVRVPVAQALDHRPEPRWGLTVGVRFLF